jgi:phospholipid/cholesterol/gamma-HCH transport system substrate-binding protein
VSIRGPLVRTVVFLLVSAFLALTTWRLLSGPALPARAGYKAVFTDVSDLKKGDDVKVAGVAVGRVDGVALDEWHSRAVVTFDVQKSLTLTSRTHAEIRYQNLTGDRYLALTQGIAPADHAATGTDLSNTQKTASYTASRGTTLAAGGEIPVTRTRPALDLDALFGGFQPLFEALTPQQVNQLSGELVQVLQGEGGTVMDLLRDVADYTVTLADRSQIIGEVVVNLNDVLATVTRHTPDFEHALEEMQQVVSGLAQQRGQLSNGLAATAELSGELGRTLRAARPALDSTSAQVQRLSALLTTSRNAAKVNAVMTALPQAYQEMAGFGSYGNWSNFYLCGLSVTGENNSSILPMTTVDSPRCRFK